MTETLLALLRTIDPRVDVYDGGTPLDAQGPAVALYGSPGTPTARRIDGQAHRATTIWQAVCSNNTAAGARRISQLVIDAVDGARLDGSLLSVPFVGPLLEDRDDPSEFRWSVTINIRHHTSRRTHV